MVVVDNNYYTFPWIVTRIIIYLQRKHSNSEVSFNVIIFESYESNLNMAVLLRRDLTFLFQTEVQRAVPFHGLRVFVCSAGYCPSLTGLWLFSPVRTALFEGGEGLYSAHSVSRVLNIVSSLHILFFFFNNFLQCKLGTNLSWVLSIYNLKINFSNVIYRLISNLRKMSGF